jgi:hypothetical protein
MRAPLEDRGFVTFYEELDGTNDQNWQPMIRAIRYLQLQQYAPRLHASTSLTELLIHAARTPDSSAKSLYVAIAYFPHKQKFRLAMGDAGSGRMSHKSECEPLQFPMCVGSLINGLLLQSEEPAPVDKWD